MFNLRTNPEFVIDILSQFSKRKKNHWIETGESYPSLAIAMAVIEHKKSVQLTKQFYRIRKREIIETEVIQTE
jgi:hypothetical protein